MEGKVIIADVLTKQGSKREVSNIFRIALDNNNLVKCVNEEIIIKNLNIKQTWGINITNTAGLKNTGKDIYCSQDTHKNW